MTYARVARLWTGRQWATDALVTIDGDGIRPVRSGSVDPAGAGRVDGTLLPPLTDSHVHLGLSDFATAGGGVLARVLDLGWNPEALSTLRSSTQERRRPIEVASAGAFLTAPGGYPSTRVWAPKGSVIEVHDAEAGVAAVERSQSELKTDAVKVCLNTDAGPVFPDDVLHAIVHRAHQLGLRVIAHVEGHGQPLRALLGGVDAFAHAPWTHALTDGELRGMAGKVSWISTIDMHGRGNYGEDYTRAMDNLTRFAAFGGDVIYGTDLGNGVTTTDLNPREVGALRAAGITGERVLEAMTGSGLLARWSHTATLLLAGIADAEEAVDALPTSRPVDADTLQQYVS